MACPPFTADKREEMVERVLGRRHLRQRVDDARRRAATTPGRLRVLSVAIAVAAIALTAVGSGTLITALVTVSRIQQQGVPAIVGMQHMHAWLSDADRCAASAYVGGGFDNSVSQLQFDAGIAATSLDVLGRLNPDDPQLRYQADIEASNRELEKAAERAAEGSEASRRLQAIAVAVARYIGFVQTANAIQGPDRSGGLLYLQAGSNLMHGPGGILDQVDQIRDLYIADLDGANVALQVTARMLVVYAIIAIGLLVLLVYTQGYVRARFRRQQNIGLLGATLLLLIVSTGSAAGAARAANDIRAGEDQAYARLASLWTTRGLVYDAHANELLSLTARGAGGQFDQAFQSQTSRLVDRPLTDQLVQDAGRGQVRFKGLLADELRAADSDSERDSAMQTLTAYQRFQKADVTVRAQVARDRASGAAIRTLSTDQTLAGSVAEVDWYLGATMQTLEGQFDATMSSAEITLSLTAGFELLAAGIAALTFWGVQPRINEYA
jgi:hypothetical protein